MPKQQTKTAHPDEIDAPLPGKKASPVKNVPFINPFINDKSYESIAGRPDTAGNFKIRFFVFFRIIPCRMIVLQQNLFSGKFFFYGVDNFGRFQITSP